MTSDMYISSPSRQRQDFMAVWCDQDGMLKLSATTAVLCDAGPMVRPNLVLARPGAPVHSQMCVYAGDDAAQS